MKYAVVGKHVSELGHVPGTIVTEITYRLCSVVTTYEFNHLVDDSEFILAQAIEFRPDKREVLLPAESKIVNVTDFNGAFLVEFAQGGEQLIARRPERALAIGASHHRRAHMRVVEHVLKIKHLVKLHCAET